MEKKTNRVLKDVPLVKLGVKSKKQLKHKKPVKFQKKRKHSIAQQVQSVRSEPNSNISLSKLNSDMDAIFEKLHSKTIVSNTTIIKPSSQSTQDTTTQAIPLKKSRSDRAAFQSSPAVSPGSTELTSDAAGTIAASAGSKKKRRKLNLLKRRQKRRVDSDHAETGESKLESARFRYLNEQLYTCSGREALKLFSRDRDAFDAYHRGFRNQVAKWPVNPLDLIIKNVNGMPPSHLVVDLGCGDARLAASVRQRVLSYDLVAVNERVTACDMAHVPLPDGAAHVAVLCLALMGTNLTDFVAETNRLLRIGGQLRIAEVASRFDDVDAFVAALKEYGFSFISQDLSHHYFYLFSLKKVRSLEKKQRAQLPPIELKPCLYKRR